MNSWVDTAKKGEQMDKQPKRHSDGPPPVTISCSWSPVSALETLRSENASKSFKDAIQPAPATDFVSHQDGLLDVVVMEPGIQPVALKRGHDYRHREIANLDATAILFSQSTVDMFKDEFDPELYEPIEVIAGDGGSYTSLDNRRLLRARNAGIRDLPVRVYGGAAALLAKDKYRFEFFVSFKNARDETYILQLRPKNYTCCIQSDEFPLEGQRNLPIKVRGGVRPSTQTWYGDRHDYQRIPFETASPVLRGATEVAFSLNPPGTPTVCNVHMKRYLQSGTKLLTPFSTHRFDSACAQLLTWMMSLMEMTGVKLMLFCAKLRRD